MKIVDRFLNVIGFEEEDVEMDPTPPPPSEEPQKRRAPLVSLAGGQAPKGVQVIVKTPVAFEEVQEIADHVKSRRPVIVNLEGMSKDDAQKILNFLSGAVYALDGGLKRISSGIFLAAPANIQVEMDLPREAEVRETNFFGG